MSLLLVVTFLIYKKNLGFSVCSSLPEAVSFSLQVQAGFLEKI
jgi:hypothetical protein